MSEDFPDGLSGVPSSIRKKMHEIDGNFEISGAIKKASNGHVFLAQNRVTKQRVVIKFYYWGSQSSMHAEPQMLAAIHSPNVLSVHDAGYVDDEWAFYIADHCSKGDLDQAMDRRRFGVHFAIDTTIGILSGLTHLHAKRLIHRDLKPSNIYLNEGNQPVIGDFGSVARIPENATEIRASAHALLYRPPESVSREMYGFTGDIYQVGIVLFQLLGGSLPYDQLAWLTKRERKEFNGYLDPVERQIFADKCLKARILRGNIVQFGSLPCWVARCLCRIVRKATATDPHRRYACASDLIAKLHERKSSVFDWQPRKGFLEVNLLSGKYRIVRENGLYVAQKQTARGGWRYDHRSRSEKLVHVVEFVESKA